MRHFYFRRIKNLLPVLCVFCIGVGCSQNSNSNGTVADIENNIVSTVENAVNAVKVEQAENIETISIDPADYGITDSMLRFEADPNISQLSLEALAAFYLHTDGAGAETSGDALYQRFLNDPDAFFSYLVKLYHSTDGNYATEEICKEIAYANVYWYEAEGKFSDILTEYQARYPDGDIAVLLQYIQNAREKAIDMNAT